MFIYRVLAAAAALAASLSAARDLPAQVADQPGHAGVYGLVRVNGQDLPVDAGQEGGCPRSVVGGKLELADGSFVLEIEEETNCAGGASSSTTALNGTVVARGDQLTLDSGGGLLHGERRGDTLQVTLGRARLAFLLGAPASAMDRYMEQYERQLAERPEGAYDCATDSSLARARQPAPADTAGLVARIAASFPGWHLSTEREIACRFPLADGSTPQTYIPEFASGEAWWVKRGDLDADGRDDVLTVLTSDADPTEDRLVALFASGRAAEIAPLGGWGFGVYDDPEGRRVVVEFWDKAADSYLWNGTRFELVAPEDECCE